MKVIDLMCLDYVAAARNRRMVRLKQNIEGYLFIEDKVRNWPRGKRLPDALLGTLPSIGKHEARELNGFHEVD